MKMDILNFNSVTNNLPKANSKSQNSSNSFDGVFAKVNNSNDAKYEKNSTKELSQVSRQQSKYDDNYKQNDNVKKADNSEDDSLKPVPKEVKDALKKAGMSDEEISKINSLKDLKDNVEPDKLLSVLLSLMGGNFANLDLSNVKDKIGEQIKSIINAEPQKFANVADEAQLKDKLINGLFDKISNEASKGVAIDTGNGDEILAKVKEELALALKEALKDLKSDKKDTKDLLSDMKFISKNLNGKAAEETIKPAESSDNSSDNSSLLNSNSKQDDGFLKNLLSDSNDKISRVTTFMSQLNNNMKVDNNAITDVQKLVINKNTVGTDMIKALKYMQTNDMKDLIVKINPKELGEVIIKVTMEAGAMKASISTANKEAYNLLNSNLLDITNKLENNDIKIQNLSLNIYNEDTTFFKDGSNKDRSGSEQKDKKSQAIGAIGEDESAIDSQNEIDSNVNILA